VLIFDVQKHLTPHATIRAGGFYRAIDFHLISL
jgi:hypothetical protein